MSHVPPHDGVMNGDHESRLQDLLAQRATEGLSAPEAAELSELLAAAGVLDEDVELDSVAATANLAMLTQSDMHAMPDSLRAKLESSGEAWAQSRSRFAAPARSAGVNKFLAFTAAACVLLAAGMWILTSAQRQSLSPVAVRSLVDGQVDTMHVALADWDNPEVRGVSGEAVWSEASQRGYLRLRDLPRAPKDSQYQLWIVDSRGMGQRISGALFDGDGQSEIIVPITPGIRVQQAAAFAITIEKPGGVWVSDMTRRVVIGSRK